MLDRRRLRQFLDPVVLRRLVIQVMLGWTFILGSHIPGTTAAAADTLRYVGSTIIVAAATTWVARQGRRQTRHDNGKR